MIEIIQPSEPKIHDEAAALDRLAVRYRNATGPGMALMAKLGQQADGLADYIPKGAQQGIHVATEKALHTAIKAADLSHRVLPKDDARLTRLVAAAMGAAGGVGGFGTALAELPLTTTLFLRSIQGAARAEGFDPKAENVRFDSVRIFASNGPLGSDESDLAFMAARMAVGGPTLQALATQVAPKLALVFGKKVAAQALPVMGAVAGASINSIYATYYREMAHVHFGLRKLAIETDQPIALLTQKLEARMN